MVMQVRVALERYVNSHRHTRRHTSLTIKGSGAVMAILHIADLEENQQDNVASLRTRRANLSAWLHTTLQYIQRNRLTRM